MVHIIFCNIKTAKIDVTLKCYPFAAQEKFADEMRYQCIVFVSFNIPTHHENEY